MHEFRATGFESLIISGGEPLLFEDLEFVLEQACQVGLHLDLCTNGVLLSRESVQTLAKYLSDVTVTLDCVDEVTFDRMKGVAGVLPAVLDGIRRLTGVGMDVTVTMVVTRWNLHLIDRNIRVLSTMGVRSVTLLSLYEGREPSPLGLEPDERRVLRELLATTLADSQGLILKLKGILFAPPDIGPCNAGEGVIGVDARGHLLPCVLIRMDDERLDLGRSSLHAAMSTEPFQRFLENKRSRQCSTCAYNGPCRKGCPATSFLTDGTVGPDTRCYICHELRDDGCS